MKSERHSIPRPVQAAHRHAPGSCDRASTEAKCLACGQIVGSMMDHSPERGKTASSKPPSNPLDMENLLHFSQQLYAHALTLQEVIRNEKDVTYEVLRPRYDRQAAQQFEIFYHTLKRPSRLRTRGLGSCE
jgi:hypothetical protein